MINICNISENFNKYKKDIIDLLVDYYGHEYYGLINQRISLTYIDFSSSPIDDYKYVMEYGNNISLYNKLIIKLRYILFRALEKKAKKINFDLLFKYIINNLLKIDPKKIKNNEKLFLSLFSDENYNSSLIDSFNGRSTELLNNNRVAKHIKESINNNRKKFNEIIKRIGIDIPHLNSDDVDKLIEYRATLQENHRNYIAMNSQYGKKMFKAIKSEFNLELQPDILSFISFLENAYAGNIIALRDNNTSFYNYIRVPLIHLTNNGIKGLDVSIIHELIHKIETNKHRVGISILNEENTNTIINEIRTQKLAIYITKKLHKQGIYIYDDPDDYKIEGESTYEWMFPLSESFLEEYERFFSNCAIKNDIEKLNDYFGPSWTRYSEHINEVYNTYMYFYIRFGQISNFPLDESITYLINEMKSTFQKKEMKKNLKF